MKTKPIKLRPVCTNCHVCGQKAKTIKTDIISATLKIIYYYCEHCGSSWKSGLEVLETFHKGMQQPLFANIFIAKNEQGEEFIIGKDGAKTDFNNLHPAYLTDIQANAEAIRRIELSNKRLGLQLKSIKAVRLEQL